MGNRERFKLSIISWSQGSWVCLRARFVMGQITQKHLMGLLVMLRVFGVLQLCPVLSTTMKGRATKCPVW